LRNVSQRNQDAYAISTGCGNFTGSSQVQCLRNLPSEYALSQANETWNLLEAGGLYWTPIIQVPTLPDQWINMYRDGKFNRVPIIVGHTAEEGRLFTAIYENSAGRPISDQDMNQIVATAGGALGSAIVETIYPSSNYGDPANRTASIVTDGQFVAGLTRVRNAISQASNATAVWAYQFRDPDAYNVNVVGKYQNIMDGHDSELPFLFQYNPGQVPPHSPPLTEGLLLAIQMGQYWGNFARTGNPNAASLPKWPQWIDISDSTPVMSFQPFNGGAQALANGTYYSAHQEAFWDPIIEASLAAANIANNI
jgi:para-nitrobenzyl esterase